MKPNKAMTPYSKSKREPKIGMTVHAGSARPVQSLATLLSLLQVVKILPGIALRDQ